MAVSRAAVESAPFPIEAAEADRFRIALFDALHRHVASLVALRAAVGSCSRHLRAQGMTPEAALLTMKAFTHHIARRGSPTDDAVLWISDPFMERIVDWCIVGYFRED
jgi:hypothetical protein